VNFVLPVWAARRLACERNLTKSLSWRLLGVCAYEHTYIYSCTCDDKNLQTNTYIGLQKTHSLIPQLNQFTKVVLHKAHVVRAPRSARGSRCRHHRSMSWSRGCLSRGDSRTRQASEVRRRRSSSSAHEPQLQLVGGVPLARVPLQGYELCSGKEETRKEYTHTHMHTHIHTHTHKLHTYVSHA
jgi:hypothetical protein